MKITHLQCVNVEAICKIASVLDDRLDTNGRSANGDVGAIDRHEVIRELSIGTVTFLVRYRVSFSAAAVTASS
jgi:hypothetical protein